LIVCVDDWMILNDVEKSLILYDISKFSIFCNKKGLNPNYKSIQIKKYYIIKFNNNHYLCWEEESYNVGAVYVVNFGKSSSKLPL
jgi:hypothetical protein